MVPDRFASVFPPLNLSESDKKYLEHLGQSLIEEHVNEYKNFITEQAGTLSSSDWQFFRQDEGIKAYVRRRTDNEKAHKRSWTWAAAKPVTRDKTQSSLSEGSNHQDELNSLIEYRCVGSHKGSLYDVMYGAVNHTLEEIRVKGEFVQDATVDAGILETVLSPTLEDPFQSLVVKYREHAHNPAVRMVAKNISFLYIEYTGLAKIWNDECIGFRLLHSVELPETKDRDTKTAVRATFAISALYRQTGENEVQTFEKDVCYSGGELQRPFMKHHAALAFARNTARLTWLAEMKKIMFIMKLRERQEVAYSSEYRDTCKQCHKPVKNKSIAKSSKKCRLCRAALCTNCCIKKRIVRVKWDQKISAKTWSICKDCLALVNHQDSFQVAKEEVAERSHYSHSSGSSNRNSNSINSSQHSNSAMEGNVTDDTSPPNHFTERSGSLVMSDQVDDRESISMSSRDSELRGAHEYDHESDESDGEGQHRIQMHRLSLD